MTDLTTAVHNLVREKRKLLPQKADDEQQQHTTLAAVEKGDKAVNEFLKEAYRINSHIQSLLRYLKSIRHSYLSINTSKKLGNINSNSSSSSSSNPNVEFSAAILPPTTTKNLTDLDRDSIDSSTAQLLRDLSSSISNLQSAEQLRHDTETQLLRKKYGRPSGVLWRWAAGDGDEKEDQGKPQNQITAEESARTIRTVRENVLWFLGRNLEQVAEVQRGMVEKRIERVREKEKSVLYKSMPLPQRHQQQQQHQKQREELAQTESNGYTYNKQAQQNYEKSTTLSAEEAASIESQLSAEQLQLFAEENDIMLRHYEDTLSKVQNAEKSLLEISSLQQTLVSHLSTQEEFISQLVTDASTTSENVGQGNKELKRATERRSTAQMVFWATTGLCMWLIMWDAIF